MAYATTAEANTYFTTHLQEGDWTGSNSDKQTKSLATATRQIDRLNFNGSKANAAQDNEFPRGTDTTVPQRIKDACCELALALVQGRDPEIELETLRLSASSYGQAKSQFDSQNQPNHLTHGIVSATAWALLLPFLRDPRHMVLHRTN